MHKLTVRGNKVFLDDYELSGLISYALEVDPTKPAVLTAKLYIENRNLSADLLVENLGDNADSGQGSMQRLISRHPENFTGETLKARPGDLTQRDAVRRQMKELEELSAPLVEWIRRNHGPHSEIRITWDRVDVKHDGMGIPFPYSEK